MKSACFSLRQLRTCSDEPLCVDAAGGGVASALCTPQKKKTPIALLRFLPPAKHYTTLFGHKHLSLSQVTPPPTSFPSTQQPVSLSLSLTRCSHADPV